MKYHIATLVLLAVPSVALAQGNAERQVEIWTALGGICVLIALLVPLLALLVVVLRRSGAMRQGEYMANAAEHLEIGKAHMERAHEHMDQTAAHMERQEERAVRIIELLESIESQLKSREGIKKL